MSPPPPPDKSASTPKRGQGEKRGPSGPSGKQGQAAAKGSDASGPPARSSKRASRRSAKKPPLRIQPTTLWDYPSQHYGEGIQGDPNYRGATPSYVIWNLLQRYTRPNNRVLDPCCGSGTTLDVCRDLDRRGIGFDLSPTRPDIFRADARRLPLTDSSVDFAFIDPPYSDHLTYSQDPRCIGRLDVFADHGRAYLRSMSQVIAELHRVLKPDRRMALYVSDSYAHGKGFFPIGFELFGQLQRYFSPVDVVAVTRHNRTLQMGNHRAAAERENFFLRGFNYLFIMSKPKPAKPRRSSKPARASKPGKSSKPGKPSKPRKPAKRSPGRAGSPGKPR